MCKMRLYVLDALTDMEEADFTNAAVTTLGASCPTYPTRIDAKDLPHLKLNHA